MGSTLDIGLDACKYVQCSLDGVDTLYVYLFPLLIYKCIHFFVFLLFYLKLLVAHVFLRVNLLHTLNIYYKNTVKNITKQLLPVTQAAQTYVPLKKYLYRPKLLIKKKKILVLTEIKFDRIFKTSLIVVSSNNTFNIFQTFHNVTFLTFLPFFTILGV